MDEKEKLFLELIDGFKWRYDIYKYPNSLFGFKEDKFIFEIEYSDEINEKKIITSYRLGIKQDLKNAAFWFNYDRIWSIFESNFEMKHNDIQFFMNDMLEKHFKMSGTTPSSYGAELKKWLEKHFKMSGTTPGDVIKVFAIQLEKHFKIKN
jgi:hypothetical protein